MTRHPRIRSRSIRALRDQAISILGLVALCSGSLFAAQTPDQADEQHIRQHLAAEHLLQEGAYTVTVENGRVILAGEVPTLNLIRRIEDQVRRADESLAVDNSLQVTRGTATDAELAESVRRSIVLNPFFDVFDWVSGTVENGIVHLEGAVREPWRSDDYAFRVGEIPGVQQIVNTIEALPLSTYDDQIRIQAARAIYRDSNFLKYAFRANPPIHIVVDQGDIRLEGVVLNSQERQIAENRVRHATLAFSVTNNLTTES